MGDVQISWRDNLGKSYPVILKGALFASDSPVNIISVTALAEQLDDNNGTWIQTSRYTSIFKWDFGKFSKTIVHPTSRLPQLQVNDRFSKLTPFYTFLENAGAVSRTHDAIFLCGAVFDNEDPTILVHPPLNSFKESEKQSESSYEIGQQLKFTRDGHCEKVTLDSVDVDMDTMVPSYNIKLKNGIITSVTKEYLSDIDSGIFSYIPSTCEKIKEQAEHINSETLQSLLHDKPPSPLLKEFFNLHERLGHMPFAIMFRLCSNERLPENCLVLQDSHLLRPSCIFAQAKREPWRQGQRQPGTVQKAHRTQPGDGIICDQALSAQPGLVPILDGRYIKDRITDVSVFLYSYSRHISYQLKYAKTIIQQLDTANPPSSTSDPSSIVDNPSTTPHKPSSLRSDPIAFIYDTDSVEYVVDSAANRLIINDSRFITNMKITSAKIKGVDSCSTKTYGTIQHHLTLTSDAGYVDLLNGIGAIYVLSPPYNLIPHKS